MYHTKTPKNLLAGSTFQFVYQAECINRFLYSYLDPLIKANDIIKLDLESNKIGKFIKFDLDSVVMVVRGRSKGRVGVIRIENNIKELRDHSHSRCSCA